MTAPPGVGKSHLGQALAHEACRRGFDVLFIDTAKMLTHLAGGRADGTHDQRLLRYTRPDLLVRDDFGLKALRPPGPEDLYDVINERYEKASILLTILWNLEPASSERLRIGSPFALGMQTQRSNDFNIDLIQGVPDST